MGEAFALGLAGLSWSPPPRSLSDSGILYEPCTLQPGTQKSLVIGTRPTAPRIPGQCQDPSLRSWFCTVPRGYVQ